jgi:hypothetical protein
MGLIPFYLILTNFALKLTNPWFRSISKNPDKVIIAKMSQSGAFPLFNINDIGL